VISVAGPENEVTRDLYCKPGRERRSGGLSFRGVAEWRNRKGIALRAQLGVALQLTNILRDSDEDATFGTPFLFFRPRPLRACRPTTARRPCHAGLGEPGRSGGVLCGRRGSSLASIFAQAD